MEGVEHCPEAESLRDLRAFVRSVRDSATIFYSSEISTARFFKESRIFNVVLKRRRIRAIGDCDGRSSQDSPTFRIAETDFLKAIATLVTCPTWTHAQFSFLSDSILTPDSFVSGFEDLMFEAFSLLRSSSSLSCVHIKHPRFCHKCLPTLLCENPCLETLRVGPGSMDFSLLAKTIALCLSRNSVLKSCTITLDSQNFNLNRESLEILLRPFTSSSQCEANVVLKELVLHLPDFIDPDAHCENAIANLVRCNTTLDRLELRFLNFRSRLKDDACKYIGRALEVNHTLKEFGCFCDLAGLKGLIASFVPNLFGRQPNTTLSTLNLFLTQDDNDRWGKIIKDDLVVILNHLASMLKSNTTLKHVRLSFAWGRHQWITGDDGRWINRKHVETRTQERLKLMIRTELRSNTSLESFAVGDWKLSRVGTKWQTSYGGPCLKEYLTSFEEYIVKVKIHQSRRRLHGIAQRLRFRT